MRLTLIALCLTLTACGDDTAPSSKDSYWCKLDHDKIVAYESCKADANCRMTADDYLALGRWKADYEDCK
jgi:hypothetical protein